MTREDNLSEAQRSKARACEQRRRDHERAMAVWGARDVYRVQTFFLSIGVLFAGMFVLTVLGFLARVFGH